MAQRHWTPADQPRANAQRSRGMSLEAGRCVYQPKGNGDHRSNPQHVAVQPASRDSCTAIATLVFAGNGREGGMGVTLCAGCALIALGPASAVFLVVVAPHADLVIRCILRCSRCCRCVLPAAALDSFLHVRLSVS